MIAVAQGRATKFRRTTAKAVDCSRRYFNTDDPKASSTCAKGTLALETHIENPEEIEV